MHSLDALFFSANAHTDSYFYNKEKKQHPPLVCCEGCEAINGG